MATYDPPQPLWKRNVAGISDFILSVLLFGFVFTKIFGTQPGPQIVIPGAVTHEVAGLSGLPLLATAIAVIAYFIVLGRTGGTIFQRLLQMKRSSGG